MKQQNFSRWLKAIIIGMGVCGAIVYFAILPVAGLGAVAYAPEFSHMFWPWLIFLWLTSLPCYGVLICCWKVAGEIGRDNSFCVKNGRMLKYISYLAAFDSAFFFLGNIALWLMNLSFPFVVLLSLILVFFGVAISVAAAVLSHLIHKAAKMREENDLTI